MKLILNTSFITLNEYIEAERTSKYKAAKIKKEMTNKVYFLAKHFKFKLKEGMYDVRFEWYKHNNRIDHDNIAFAKKFILDGLVEADVIVNDNPKYIRNFTDVFLLDTTKNYISCIVYFNKV